MPPDPQFYNVLPTGWYVECLVLGRAVFLGEPDRPCNACVFNVAIELGPTGYVNGSVVRHPQFVLATAFPPPYNPEWGPWKTERSDLKFTELKFLHGQHACDTLSRCFVRWQSGRGNPYCDLSRLFNAAVFQKSRELNEHFGLSGDGGNALYGLDTNKEDGAT